MIFLAGIAQYFFNRFLGGVRQPRFGRDWKVSTIMIDILFDSLSGYTWKE